MEKYIPTKGEIDQYIRMIKIDIENGEDPNTRTVAIHKHNEKGERTHESVFTLKELEALKNGPIN